MLLLLLNPNNSFFQRFSTECSKKKINFLLQPSRTVAYLIVERFKIRLRRNEKILTVRLFSLFQVSFFSTSPELSNKQRFEYFSRTIPSDHYQVKAMVEIVRRLGWSYISIIYEESNYGVKAFEELEELLAEYNICIAVKEKLVKDSGVAQERAYDTIVQKLLTKSRARGE